LPFVKDAVENADVRYEPFIEKLVTRLDGIQILSEKRHQEREPGFERIHGYDFLRVRFDPLGTPR
jgi:hypothetical protein